MSIANRQPGSGLPLADLIKEGNFGLRDEMAEVIERRLDDREAHVIGLRFGLYDGIQRSLQEIGRGMGISREAVRKIELRAPGKLREEVTTSV